MRQLRFVFIMSLLVFLFSCDKKDTEREVVPDIGFYTSSSNFIECFNVFKSIRDDVNLQQLFLNVNIYINLIYNADTLYPIVSYSNWDGVNDAKYNILIDYGKSGTYSTGRNFKGRINMEVNGFYGKETYYARHVNSDSLFVDNYKVDINYYDTFLGLYTDTSFVEMTLVNQFKITKTTGAEVLLTPDTIFHNFITGNLSWWDFGDDTIDMTFNSTGINENYFPFKQKQQGFFRILYSCGNILEGKTTIISDNIIDSVTLDFGEGQCDNKAEIYYHEDVWPINF